MSPVRRPAPRRPAPPPYEGDDQLMTLIITVGWVIALVVLLIVKDQLPAADRWWVWVPVAGVCAGLFGLVYVPHLKRSRQRAAERRRQQRDDQAARGESVR